MQIGSTPLSNEVSNLEAKGSGQGPTGPIGISGSAGPTGPVGPAGEFFYLTPTPWVSATGCIMKYGTQVICNYSFGIPAHDPETDLVISDCPAGISPSILPGSSQDLFMVTPFATRSVHLIFGENTISLRGTGGSPGTCFANFSYLL